MLMRLSVITIQRHGGLNTLDRWVLEQERVEISDVLSEMNPLSKLPQLHSCADPLEKKHLFM